jgi:Ca-activated chloride channel family protein
LIKLLITSLAIILVFNTSAQYYIRGEVKDEKNEPLQNVKIYMHSNHLLYYSGTTGGFGISTNLFYDSLTFNVDGYEPKTIKVKVDVYQEVSLKSLSASTSNQRQKLISVTKDLDRQSKRTWLFGDESYSNLVENDFIKAGKYPNTGFSLRVDKASYSNIRRFINQKSIVPPDAVRIEEMLNYFNLNYQEPDKDKTFKIESQLTSCPWNIDHQLLFLNINAKKLDAEKIPPSNFVFLIDVSGSMDMPNRLPLLKAAFQLMVNNLRKQDTVSIVVYGGYVGVWLQPTSGAEKKKITKSIEELDASGNTPGEAAIRAAYKLAQKTFIKGGNNRIILATDGDFNIGQTSEKDLEDLISKERQTGVYLTCLGVGMGNYKDSKIEALAKKGNGNFAYLDDIHEAEKVLVSEFTQTLYTVAKDVFLLVQFNPNLVKEYRLIGYDNKKNVLIDSTNELEGGEMGSGNGITSIFEIIPTDNKIITTLPNSKDQVAFLTLNFKIPEDTVQNKYNFSCPNNYMEFKTFPDNLKFAAAVTMFGLKLRDSKYMKGISWEEVEIIAAQSVNEKDYLQNQFMGLVKCSKKIYTPKKKNQKKTKIN